MPSGQFSQFTLLLSIQYRKEDMAKMFDLRLYSAKVVRSSKTLLPQLIIPFCHSQLFVKLFVHLSVDLFSKLFLQLSDNLSAAKRYFSSTCSSEFCSIPLNSSLPQNLGTVRSAPSDNSESGKETIPNLGSRSLIFFRQIWAEF